MTLSKFIKSEISILIEKYKENKIEDDKFISEINKLINMKDPKIRTIASRSSNIIKILKNNKIKSEIYNKIKPPNELTMNIIKKNLEIRDKKKLIQIKQIDIKEILSFEKSNDIYKLGIYLLLVSGLRTSELFSDIKKYKHDNNVLVNGIKKKRDGDQTGIVKPLINKTKFIRLHNKFLDMSKRKKPFNIKSFSRNLNIKIKKLVNKEYHPHNLRGIYVHYLYKHYNYDKLKINTFIKKYLNHNSINSSMNYTGYKLEENIKIN